MSNQKTVYILGAGFSADAGIPTDDGFLDRMRDFEGMGREEEGENKLIQEVLEYRLAASACSDKVLFDLENIENLFSLASMSQGDGREGFLYRVARAIALTIDSAAARAANKDLILSWAGGSALKLTRFGGHPRSAE